MYLIHYPQLPGVFGQNSGGIKQKVIFAGFRRRLRGMRHAAANRPIAKRHMITWSNVNTHVIWSYSKKASSKKKQTKQQLPLIPNVML